MLQCHWYHRHRHHERTGILPLHNITFTFHFIKKIHDRPISAVQIFSGTFLSNDPVSKRHTSCQPSVNVFCLFAGISAGFGQWQSNYRMAQCRKRWNGTFLANHHCMRMIKKNQLFVCRNIGWKWKQHISQQPYEYTVVFYGRMFALMYNEQLLKHPDHTVILQ